MKWFWADKNKQNEDTSHEHYKQILCWRKLTSGGFMLRTLVILPWNDMRDTPVILENVYHCT